MTDSTSHPPLTSDQLRAIGIRTVVWVTLFAVLYLLQSFFLLIFLTFLFAYIQTTGVTRLEPRIRRRTVRVVVVFLALLGVLGGLISFLAPRVRNEADTFAQRIPAYLEATDNEIRRLSVEYPLIAEVLPGIDVPVIADENGKSNSRVVLKNSPTGMMLQRFLSPEEDDRADPGTRQVKVFQTIRNTGAYLGGILSAFMLSLLFSFLIVLDMESLRRSIQNLGRSRVAFIYDAVAPSIATFGRVLGRAIEAQLMIAILNSVFTAVGMYMLGIGEKVTFLSVIVFACSFIPVAGVFISSVPICLVALQNGGVTNFFLAIGLITTIHLIECYILNPKIYGHHMRMNPVVVLIILTIAGKMFHVWGLILGVPVCTYIFGHAIRNAETEEPATVG